jgi:hypothetical protein
MPNVRNPIQFPLDDIQYLHALAQDYLELMGESEQMTSNTLLIEYTTDTPNNTVLNEDNT